MNGLPSGRVALVTSAGSGIGEGIAPGNAGLSKPSPVERERRQRHAFFDGVTSSFCGAGRLACSRFL